jgi:hypothetical protein
MTELEFEKACRGPEFPVHGEYAWHTAGTPALYGIEYAFYNLGEPNEYPQNPGTGTFGNASWEYTTGHKFDWADPTVITHPNRLDGPVRAGIFATSTSNRINAGASYYGILDLSGGVNERCVTLGKIQGRVFRGTHGDGKLTEAPFNQGNATNLDWPGILANRLDDGVITFTGSGYKGQDYNDGRDFLKVSDRTFAAHDPYVPGDVGPDTQYVSSGSGNIGSGFRCVRTAE